MRHSGKSIPLSAHSSKAREAAGGFAGGAAFWCRQDKRAFGWAAARRAGQREPSGARTAMAGD
ncbi:hypothetical protein [Anaerobacterium chartisolvens]|uniref:hypothetical protein n=1 Tax=Anaerobacterium chartisolvens TaxID=1297424 RepID=UPI0011C019C0|nr:hypothetical protein [Anaerobacterium chartisolvens]